MQQKLNYVPFLAVLSIIIALYWSLNYSQDEYKDKLSSLELTLISDEKLDLSKFKGSSYVIHLFASWCSACKDDFVFLDKIAQQTDAPIIGIAINDRLDRLRLLNKETWPYSYIAIDIDMKVRKLLQSKVMPETIIVSKEGDILLRYIGGLTDQVVKNRIIPLIQSQ